MNNNIHCVQKFPTKVSYLNILLDCLFHNLIWKSKKIVGGQVDQLVSVCVVAGGGGGFWFPPGKDKLVNRIGWIGKY